MTDLFENEKQLLDSGYLFRITDNGGASQDRFTIVTSDGDYFASDATPFYALGFFQSGEGIDVNALSDRVENGVERDLRWIDLPEDVRRAVFQRINEGFRDWIESEAVPVKRRDAEDRSDGHGSELLDCIWARGDGKFLVRDDEDGDRTFDSMVEAVRFCLPDVHELSGPEYHSTVDLADETGGPAPLWDCDADPAKPYEVTAVRNSDAPAPVDGESMLIDIADAASFEEVREVAAKWQADNPDKAPRYHLCYSSKAGNVLRAIPETAEKFEEA